MECYCKSSKVNINLTPELMHINHRSSFLLGGPTTATLFVLPSRFQLVNGLSGLDAGVRLLPFALGTGFGAVIGSILTGRVKIPSMYIALMGSMLQVVGLAVLGVVPATVQILPRTYGLQVVAGLGCGITYQSFYITMPIVTSRYNAGKSEFFVHSCWRHGADLMTSYWDRGNYAATNDGRRTVLGHCHISV